jgi:DnaJ-class molecular chaperone
MEEEFKPGDNPRLEPVGRKCEECQGDGRFHCGTTEQTQALARNLPCPTCGGKGWVPDEPYAWRNDA